MLGESLRQSTIGAQGGGCIERLVLRVEHSSGAFAWSSGERWDRVAQEECVFG